MNFKHTLVIYALLSMSGSICHVAAQSIKYPTEVKELYNTADKAAMLTKYPRPVIGVPTTPDTKAEVAAVEKAGGIAIFLPPLTRAHCVISPDFWTDWYCHKAYKQATNTVSC